MRKGDSFTLTIRVSPDGAGLRLSPSFKPSLTESRKIALEHGAEPTPIEGAGLAALGAAGAFLDGLTDESGREYAQRES